jgi:hypothetical protein
MKSRLAVAIVVLTVFAALFCLFPEASSANYTVTYQLLDHLGGSTHYRLNVAISDSLYQYYVDKDHKLITENDFGKFVTPYTFKPVSDCLRQLYDDDEAFVNGVLMIVHQITYEETRPPRYPVETIAVGDGDCDLFSYVAASIIKAGGLDVVLLYYASESHMNVGVNLSQDPVETRSGVQYVMHDGKKYYVAECTGEDWQNGWRVGECPDNLKQASLQVVTLEGSESSAPGQVSASYNSLHASMLSFDSSTGFLIEGGTVTFSGQLSPVMSEANVTIYIKVNGLPWSNLATTQTDSTGHFRYVWNAATAGICSVRASWSGDESYAATDSPVHTITVLSLFFVSLLSITIVLVCIGVSIFLLSRKAGQASSEPEPPEIPS